MTVASQHPSSVTFGRVRQILRSLLFFGHDLHIDYLNTNSILLNLLSDLMLGAQTLYHIDNTHAFLAQILILMWYPSRLKG